MRKALAGIGTAVLLAGCTQAVENKETEVSAPARSDAETRALRQLESRLAEKVVLADLATGADEGKPLLCGVARAGDQATPFVLRNGFLLLPDDLPPETFARVRAKCDTPLA